MRGPRGRCVATIAVTALLAACAGGDEAERGCGVVSSRPLEEGQRTPVVVTVLAADSGTYMQELDVNAGLFKTVDGALPTGTYNGVVRRGTQDQLELTAGGQVYDLHPIFCD
jgi:hypothetical protein